MLDADGERVSRTRAKALLGAGQLALFQGDLAAAVSATEESLALSHGRSDPEGVAAALTRLGYVAAVVLDRKRLAEIAAELAAIRPKLQDPRTVAGVLD